MGKSVRRRFRRHQRPCVANKLRCGRHLDVQSADARARAKKKHARRIFLLYCSDVMERCSPQGRRFLCRSVRLLCGFWEQGHSSLLLIHIFKCRAISRTVQTFTN